MACGATWTVWAAVHRTATIMNVVGVEACNGLIMDQPWSWKKKKYMSWLLTGWCNARSISYSGGLPFFLADKALTKFSLSISLLKGVFKVDVNSYLQQYSRACALNDERRTTFIMWLSCSIHSLLVFAFLVLITMGTAADKSAVLTLKENSAENIEGCYGQRKDLALC